MAESRSLTRQNLISLAQSERNENKFSPDKMANMWTSPVNADEDKARRELTDAQMVLLCTDYLRDLRRSFSMNRGDLEAAEGLNADYMTMAIWALSRSFTRPKELVHSHTKKKEEETAAYLDRPFEYGNDSYFQPEYAHLTTFNQSNKKQFQLTDQIRIPSLQQMEDEFLYQEKPRRTMEELISTPTNKNQGYEDGSPDHQTRFNFIRNMTLSKDKEAEEDIDRSRWYEYEDAHYSNLHRFYELGGLADTPLKLTALTSRGMEYFDARTRGNAESEMVQDELFAQFVDAVDSTGFFKITEDEMVTRAGKEDIPPKQRKVLKEQINEERYRKVLSKYRSKLASKKEEEELHRQEQEHILEEEEEEEYGNGQSPRKTPQKSPRHSSSRHSPSTTILSKQQHDEHRCPSPSDNASEEEKRQEKELSQSQMYPDDDDMTIMGQSVIADLSERENHATEAAEREHASDHGDENIERQSKVDEKLLQEAERFKSLGNAQMQQKKYERAKTLYTNALKLLPTGPTSHVYYSNRAAAYLSMREFRKAVDDSQRSLKLKPDFPKAHSRLGLSYFLLGEYKEATDAYTLAVKYEPNNQTSVGYLEKSRKKYLASMEKDDDKSVRSHKSQKSDRRKSKSKSKEGSGGDIIRDNKGESKIKRLSSLRELKRDSPRGSLRSQNASSVDRSKSPQHSRRAVSRERDSSRSSSRFNLIQRSVSNSSPQIELSDFDSSPEKTASPSKSPLRARLERSKSASRRRLVDSENQSSSRNANNSDKQSRKRDSSPSPHKRSSNDNDGSTLDQKEADRLKGEGNKYMSKREYEKAVKSYSKALRVCPAGNNSHVYFSNRAAALCYLERYEEAELDSERSLALNPEYGKAHARLGLSRYFLKDYEGAVEAYESALLHDPDNAASKSYLAKAKSKISRRSRQSAS